MSKLYPEELLFSSPLEERDGMVSYPPALASEVFEFCQQVLLNHISPDIYFPCVDDND